MKSPLVGLIEMKLRLREPFVDDLLSRQGAEHDNAKYWEELKIIW